MYISGRLLLTGLIQMTVFQLKRKPAKKKSAAQRLWFLHWLMASFYLLLFASGFYMMGSPLTSNGWSAYDFHKTLGVTVMSLLLARIFVLLIVLRHKYKRRQQKRTRLWVGTFVLHMALYFFMLLVPLSGYFAANATDENFIIFGTGIVLPNLFNVNSQLVEFIGNAHFWLAYAFVGLIVLHMASQKRYLQAQVRRLFKATFRTITSRSKATKNK